MKIGIMQPYFMPYIGYWQRIHAVDVHVIFDDVNYIKSGWMHRNRIIINGCTHYLHLSVRKASQNKKINETFIIAEKALQERMLKTLECSYRKAPFFADAMEVLTDIIMQKEENLAKYLSFQIQKICWYFGIKTKILISSDIDKNNSLKGQEKIMDICKQVGKSAYAGGITYVNASSGEHLYNKNDFRNQNLNLEFIKNKSSVYYTQMRCESFIPSLSVIDIMMNCSLDSIQKLLNDYVIY